MPAARPLDPIRFNTPFVDVQENDDGQLQGLLTAPLQKWFAAMARAISMLLALANRAPGRGPDVVSANNVVLASYGDTFVVTGVVQINTVATGNVREGQEITLVFSANVTVAHNTAGTGAPFQLAGAVPFAATVDDTLTLRLVTSPSIGALRWMEVARTVI